MNRIQSGMEYAKFLSKPNNPEKNESEGRIKGLFGWKDARIEREKKREGRRAVKTMEGRRGNERKGSKGLKRPNADAPILAWH
jgi:hypothetical protein